ncbi:MAG: GNAT family N-acetyltransferase [Alphaproteobacteria bacterium]
MSKSEFIIEVVQNLVEVDGAAWDACAGNENPFVSYNFLFALEESKSAVVGNGWLGQHVLLKSADTEDLLGVVPLYLKNHSQGEYVFDHGWADAFERAGGQYYPKLQSCVPFSPVTGPRLMARKDTRFEASQIKNMLVRGMLEVGKRHGVSNLHVTFCENEDLPLFENEGFLPRYGHQYHWQNKGYSSFDDFLDELTSRKRKAIRKERKAVLDSGVELKTLTGDDLQTHNWDKFFEFYLDTGSRKWGQPYLTREFFDQIHQTMKDRIALVVGFDEGEMICGALNMVGSNTIFGRNWGCLESVKHLHFEACYYQAIEFAIEHKLAKVEAGAQGHHKLQRGYLPTLTYSAHYLYDKGFSGAVSDYLVRERGAVLEDLDLMRAESPFKVD